MGAVFTLGTGFLMLSSIMGSMQNNIVRISDAEAVNEFQRLLDQVRQGAEVIIEHESHPVAILRPVEPQNAIVDILTGISQEISDEDWASIPSDLSKNLDHYLYRTGKLSG